MRKSLFAIPLLLPILAWAAQSPFEGTWDFAPLEFGTEVLLLQDGIFQDSTANPSIKVRADGTDQPNPPDSKTDTVAVKVVDDETVEMIIKRDGKVIEQNKHTVSADGKTIIKEFRLNPEAGTGKRPETGKWTLSCVAAGPAGSHAISGKWSIPGTTMPRTVTFKSSPDGLIMSSLFTLGKDIKVDGKDYPMRGLYGFQGRGGGGPDITVSLTQVNDRTISQTVKKDGKIDIVFTYTVSDDGKTLTEKREENGTTSTEIATKQ
jgi:hypothetical protein